MKSKNNIPRIENLAEKKLIGKRLKMSFADSKTVELWRTFMPQLKKIINKTGAALYSVEIYEPQFFDNFAPENKFEKWAAVEVSDFDYIPNELENIIIPPGLYAVFLYRGKSSEAAETYRYIFEKWLPESEFSQDDRPHFAKMGENYKNEDPNSEEELWIPIKWKENGKSKSS